MTQKLATVAFLIIGAPLALAAANAQSTPAPEQAATPEQAAAPAATPTPAETPAPAKADTARTPLDQLLVTAKPMTADPKSSPRKLEGATTDACTTNVTLEGGAKLSIDLKKMQAMAVNTNLIVSGGGHSVQMEFEGKDAAKQAADAEKLISALNDKCL
ncbi:MAG: hypothetical protein WC816_10000 [Sphingomonas sp.]|jgi:hypothetical protein